MYTFRKSTKNNEDTRIFLALTLQNVGFESAKHFFVNEDIGVVVKTSKPANKFVFN